MDFFVVVGGEYSDYHIVKIFIDEAKAEAFVEARKGSYLDYRIEK